MKNSIDEQSSSKVIHYLKLLAMTVGTIFVYLEILLHQWNRRQILRIIHITIPLLLP